jgi:hypothetical protein
MTKKGLMKVAALALLGIGTAGLCFAPVPTPEIDGASGANALALFAGVLLIVRSRRS